MTTKIKVWDIVYRKKENCGWSFKSCDWPFLVTNVNCSSIKIKREIDSSSAFQWEWDINYFYIAPEKMLPTETTPTTITTPTMQYFHTAVIIKIADSTQNEYKELVPYKVRTAISNSDLEKTMLRELPPEINHNDVKFLISLIF